MPVPFKIKRPDRRPRRMRLIPTGVPPAPLRHGPLQPFGFPDRSAQNRFRLPPQIHHTGPVIPPHHRRRRFTRHPNILGGKTALGKAVLLIKAYLNFNFNLHEASSHACSIVSAFRIPNSEFLKSLDRSHFA